MKELVHQRSAYADNRFWHGGKSTESCGKEMAGPYKQELKLHLTEVGKHTEPFVYIDQVVYKP